MSLKYIPPLLIASLLAGDAFAAQNNDNIRTGPLILREVYAKAINPDAGDHFGWAVSVEGNTMVVGSPFEDSNATGVNGNSGNDSLTNSGAAYVFERDVDGNWSYAAYLKPEAGTLHGQFGRAVAVSGNLIVVGGPYCGIGGEAVVYRKSGANWTLEETITGAATESGDEFGYSVAIDGGIIMVGAPREDGGSSGANGNQFDNGQPDSGAVYAFTRDSQGWQQEGYLKSSDPDVNDTLGTAVAISQDAVVIGVPGESSASTGVNGDPFNNASTSSGAAYVYRRITGGVWSIEGYLKASNTGSADVFGSSVSIAGEAILVGAPREDSDGTGYNPVDNDLMIDSGAAYVFIRPFSDWEHHAFLKPMNTTAGYQFGHSVSNFGDIAAIGAWNDSSPSYGVNGDGSTRIGILPNSGSIQSYVRELGLWLPFAYFKSPDPDANDLFGRSVSISDGLLVAGVSSEDGNGSEVSGDFFNNSMTNAGAAFCFNVAPDSGLSRYGTYYGPNYADLYSYGNPTAGQFFNLQLSGFTNAGPAALVLSRQPDWLPRDGGVIHLDLSPGLLLLPGGYEWVPVAPIDGNPLNSGGAFEVFFPAITVGFTMYGQAAKHDPNLPGLALSNGLMMVVGS